MNTREAAKFVRKYRIDDNCILVVKDKSIISEQREAIGKAIEKAGIKNVILLVVDDMDDVKTLNKLDMNRAGWFRIDDIRRLISPRPIIIQKGEENSESS